MNDGAWHYFRVKHADARVTAYVEWVTDDREAPSAASVQFTLQLLYLGCAAESCTHAEAFGHGVA